MSLKIVAVFHASKVVGLGGSLDAVAANPPMTIDGMEEIHKILPAIEAYGPFASMYCSRLARAGDAASVIATAFDMDYQTIKKLGQHANMDGKILRYYPGFEKDNFLTWQADGIEALKSLAGKHGRRGETVIVVSHRPILGGVVAHCQGAKSPEEVYATVCDQATVGKGFRIFEVTYDSIKLLE